MSADLIVAGITITSVGWYLTGANRYRWTLVPLGYLLCALMTKVATIPLNRGK